ncbi:MAG TPA: type II toxin-antitoxin system VapC family toxin [Prosthecobacter sp.]
MFAVLDTNHFVEMVDGSPLGDRLMDRVRERKAQLFTTIITVQETSQGWFAAINRHAPGMAQVEAYEDLHHSLDAFCQIISLHFDREAAAEFEKLKKLRLRVGTMDLKIAAICLAHDAVLLTRNLVDFEKIPALRIENWLD